MKILILQIVVLISVTLSAQGSYNMYSTYPKTQAPTSQYVPSNIDWNAIQAAGERKQAQYNQNKLDAENLILWIVETKAKVSEEQFINFLNNKQRTLESYQNTDYSLLSNDISQIHSEITKELDNYNYRVKNAPEILWNNAKEHLKTAASNSEYPLLQLDNYDAAIKDLSELISLKPDFINAYGARGFAYYRKGDMQLAKADYITYTNTVKTDKSSYEILGWAKYYTKDYIGALAAFNSQVSLDTSNSVAYYNRGSAKSELGDNYGAILDYTKAIKLSPSFSMAYNNRGWSKYKQQKYNDALVDLNKAIQLDGNNSVAYDSRQEVKFALKDYDGCIADCNKCIELNPKLANAYLIRGRAYYRKGNKEQACLDWSKAGELGKVEAYDLIVGYCK